MKIKHPLTRVLILTTLSLSTLYAEPNKVLNSTNQFKAQQQQKYEYSTQTAMGSPVVLPMDGRLDTQDLLTGYDVSLWDILFPHFHVDSAYGTSTRPQEDLQVGHHDPSTRGWTWQNIEAALSGRINDYNEFFVTYAGNISPEGDWNGLVEEWFWKFKNLPGNFELRLGQTYSRFGIQNTYHPHGFEWVDQYLVNGRLLGEDSLTIRGVELTWILPTSFLSSSWNSQLDIAYGRAPKNEEHGHEEEEESRFHAEEAQFNDEDNILAANWTNVYTYNDFNLYRMGVSGVWGKNLAQGNTHIYGVHLEYQWRQNGYASGGRYFRLRGEAMFRRFEVGEEVGGDEVLSEFQKDWGYYLSALYGFNNRIELGLRTEFVSGDLETGMDNRMRISPAVTYYLNEARTLRFRLQYNYDRSSHYGTDHGVWGQLSFSWGGPEVR